MIGVTFGYTETPIEELNPDLVISRMADLPQAVDAAGNNHAQTMLARDVNNLRTYFGQFAPALLATQYAEEIWALYEHGKLNPEVELSGRFECDKPPVDLEGVMREIDDAREEEAARLLRLQALA